MSIFLRTVPFRTVPFRTVPFRTVPFCHVAGYRQMSRNCPENSNLFSTTFKVYCCILLSTSVICNHIKMAVRVLREDRADFEKRLYDKYKL